jgi:serine/threonine protein kinase
MGVVYAAHDPRLDRRVALKMIRQAAADDRARERLWREARAAASLSHPNVCQLYDQPALRNALRKAAVRGRFSRARPPCDHG